ncbi:competence/damage-inducible protein A [Nocardioides insulae]|uniref:competence/damage-inducible protein A n=1 Tax=Nocardioides insulae TaxID=394734 RepID=UPI00040FA473|nr:competence/damage-inducible protein A [Nocardioides insulae]
MTSRAGIVVTGTEVLTGRVADANGPWLAERLRERGVDVGQIVVVGDRPDDMRSALAHLAATNDLVITTGGLGPTADDLTAELVGDFQGRPLEYDAALRDRIAVIVDRLVRARGWSTPPADFEAGTRKQALVPRGARILEPVGTAPGLVVPALGDGPAVLVLPGPPAELRAMWPAALADDLVSGALGEDTELCQETIRVWGPPEAELAAVLREHEQAHDLSALEISTCLREGELEVVTRHPASAQAAYRTLEKALVAHFGERAYAIDGSSLDDVVALGLRDQGATVATAESCTGGLLSSRLLARPGSSAYVSGGFIAYSNAAKVDQLGVPQDLLWEHGAVSEEVARAMAAGARARLGTTYGIGMTGISGPGGGTPGKPVGLVHVAVDGPTGSHHRRLRLAGGRTMVRERTVVHALHLLREVLAGLPPESPEGA